MISMCRGWPGFRLAPEPATFGSFLYTDMWSPPCSVLARTEGNHGYSFVGHGPADVGARASRIRELPTHGYVEPTLLRPARNKGNHGFSFDGHGPTDVGARTSRIREVPIHGYAEPSLLPSLLDLKEIVAFQSSVIAPRTLAPAPAAFGSFLHADDVEPFSLHPYSNCRNSLFSINQAAPRPSGARASHHRVTLHTRICGALLAPSLPE